MQRSLKHRCISLLSKYVNEILGAFSYMLFYVKRQVAEI